MPVINGTHAMVNGEIVEYIGLCDPNGLYMLIATVAGFISMCSHLIKPIIKKIRPKTEDIIP